MTIRRRKKKAAGRKAGGAGRAKKKTSRKKATKKTRKKAGKARGATARKAKRAKRRAPRKAPESPAALKAIQPGLEKALSRVLGGMRRKLDKLPKAEAQLKLLQMDAGGFTYTLNRLRPAPADNLTDRQKEIARLVSHGLSNKQIGAKLRISPATVAAHLRTIFTKLRVRTRTALAKHALAYYG